MLGYQPTIQDLLKTRYEREKVLNKKRSHKICFQCGRHVFTFAKRCSSCGSAFVPDEKLNKEKRRKIRATSNFTPEDIIAYIQDIVDVIKEQRITLSNFELEFLGSLLDRDSRYISRATEEKLVEIHEKYITTKRI